MSIFFLIVIFYFFYFNWESRVQSPVQGPVQVLYYAVEIFHISIFFFSGILSQDIGCKPRKVLIPIDAPRYQFFPRFAEVFRCGGACSTLSPNIQQCRAASWNNLTGQIFDLSRVTDPLKEAVFENHTSCQCECVVKAEDCSENEVYKAEQCNCECKYENNPPPCPERFTYVSLLLITISIISSFDN